MVSLSKDTRILGLSYLPSNNTQVRREIQITNSRVHRVSTAATVVALLYIARRACSAISTNPKPTIYRNLYENTAPELRALNNYLRSHVLTRVICVHAGDICIGSPSGCDFPADANHWRYIYQAKEPLKCCNIFIWFETPKVFLLNMRSSAMS